MGQMSLPVEELEVSLPVEECSLIRGRGHQRSLSQDRGPLVTGPPMTVLVGWARARFASPECI